MSSEPKFVVEARGLSDGIGHVAVAGEVDVATAPQLKQVLLEVLDDGATSLRVDVAQVAFIDSAGLGVLIGVLTKSDIEKMFPDEQEKAMEKSLQRMVADGLLVRVVKGIYLNPAASSKNV